jgi:predicted dehydrogenase/threonine dehydrogenase-like Zn-dependent dehydrogenase
MKQILQNLGSGETILAEVASPSAGRGQILVHSSCSLVSLGTEKMLIDFGKSGWIAKARSQPDKVKQVLQKIKTDGLWATLDAVKAKLDTPIPLGYCNVGIVHQVAPDSPFRIGDRVASNGPHAEQFAVSTNLAAKIPAAVSDEEAAFTVVGAIGLQGIRLLQPTLGEKVVVFGLGLIGLLAVQMLRANGCHVLGIDFDEKKLELAHKFGAHTCHLAQGQDPVQVAEQWTQGIGVDGVLITASTKSDELIHQAATMCRQRGKIVLVGVVGLNLQRADFYEKELSFQVSCSYGPGRYDPLYEKQGLDYPIGFVRWTEQRNFEAVLQLMAQGLLDVKPLITHRYIFDQALEGYGAIQSPGAMGIVLQYGPQITASNPEKQTQQAPTPHVAKPSNTVNPQPISGLKRDIGIAFVGAGGFTTRMLMPLLPKHGIRKIAVASQSGVTASHAAKKFQFERVASNIDEVLKDERVDAVFIATPHNSHATLVEKSLQAGKHVFVEKPLALNLDELNNIERALDAHSDRCLLVGFNRRFSPHLQQLKKWIASAPSNKALVITVNAGAIPQKHWTQDVAIGGGRILGEGCHFIDVARYLIGHPIASTQTLAVQGGDGRLHDCVTLGLAFTDGSTASIHYLSNGHSSYPKERIEVFAGGKVYVCDNFRKSYEFGGRRSFRTSAQDKGHANELKAFLDTIREGGPWPISKSELLEVSQATIAMAQQLRS